MDGSTRSFRVRPLEVFAPDAKVVANDGKSEWALELPDVSLFEGEDVAGGTRRIILSIARKRAVWALIFDGSTVVTVLQPVGEAGDSHSIIDPAATPLPDKPFCDGAVSSPGAAASSTFGVGETPVEEYIAGTTLAAEVLIDIGYPLYQYLGSNTPNSTEYAANVMGAASAIYRRDMNIALWVKQMRVWVAPDPFDGADTDVQLSQYRSWNKANSGAISRDLAHLLTKKYGLGGRAYLDALCSTDIGYGVSNLDGYYSSFPTSGYQWDISVVAHELGHNFGSPHTHCYSPRLDRCYAGEAGCYSGPEIPSVGEIMSYCHLYYLSELEFRATVGSRIRTGATTHSCIAAAPGTCGDGVVVGSVEQCDDGNTVSGDGCDLTCVIEPCWTCSGMPSVCTPRPDGTSCSDANSCTGGDSCSGGTCSGRYGCTVVSAQKISQTAGNFTGVLANSDRFGISGAGLGDLDGDGVADIAVGANGDNQAATDAGAIWVLLLQADGTVKSHVKITENVGGFTGSLVASDNFGVSVANIGDLDDDGLVDLAVGASLVDDGGSNRGAVFILFMNADGTVKANQRISSTVGGLTGLANGDQFGGAVTGLGDLDGDGVEDIAVGAPNDSTAAGAAAGSVYVLFLNTSGTVKTQSSIAGANAGASFGWSVSGLDDTDSDGVRDLIVGAPFINDGGSGRGGAIVVRLNSNGTVKSTQRVTATDGNFYGPLTNGDNFGKAVAALPDIDGDGRGEIAVGAPGDDDGGTDTGAVYQLILYSDGTIGPERKISALFQGLPAGLDGSDFFGSSVAVVGDLDGKGQHELVVGSYGDDDGGTDRGAVRILFRDGCGGGLVSAGEECDDGNEIEGDGCSSSCEIEVGWTCSGGNSVCSAIRGDGVVVGSEECDDGNLISGDGCSAFGTVEDGYNCSGEPSACVWACGNGIVDPPGEQCDDGNTQGGDCCDPTCQYDVVTMPCGGDSNPCTDHACDGAGACVPSNNAAMCEDGDLCTGPDQCAGGACVPGASIQCDDGSDCTIDSCDSGVGCVTDANILPDAMCLKAAKVSLQVKNTGDPSKSQVKWKWGKGDAFDHLVLGAPDATTSYTLCIYDSSGDVPSYKASIDIAPGSLWQSKDPKGWNYIDKPGSSDGVQKLQLKTGADGKTKAQVKAGGINLPVPAPLSPTEYFDQDPNVIAQLISSEGFCLTSELGAAGTSKNDGEQFKAKAP